MGVASLGPGGARAPPDFFENYNYLTSRSAVYSTGKSEIGEKFCSENFSQKIHLIF